MSKATRRIDDLSPQEKRALLAKLMRESGRTPDPLALPVHRLFEAQVTRTPLAVAAGFEGTTLTFEVKVLEGSLAGAKGPAAVFIDWFAARYGGGVAVGHVGGYWHAPVYHGAWYGAGAGAVAGAAIAGAAVGAAADHAQAGSCG